MTKNIFYDHAYTLDPKHKFLFELKKFGFHIEDMTVEHPGKAFCRFIMFKESASALPQYLEFVDQRQKPSKNQERVPGLSFRYEKDLLSFSKRLGKNGLRVSYDHKNYTWKKNSKDRLPGWNFMSFKNIPIRSYYPWFTEYEPHPTKKRKKGKIVHPNGAYGIYGIELSTNKKGLEFYSALFGKTIKQKVLLPAGVQIFFKNQNKNQLNTVILKVKSLKKLETFAKKTKLKCEKTDRGLRLINPHHSPLMYNLEFVEV